ncbi:MAG: ribose-5-phosphate isomerase A, partial [Acetobacter sp.]
IPTSVVTERQAREEGIELTTFASQPELDIAIDGADEIEPRTLNLIKGLGGALLWEKIVASAARQFVVVADASKYVDHLGARCPLPVEVIPFGWKTPPASWACWARRSRRAACATGLFSSRMKRT